MEFQKVKQRHGYSHIFSSCKCLKRNFCFMIYLLFCIWWNIANCESQLFQRDKPALCLKIRCKNKVKKVKRSFDSKPLQHNSISSHISERSEKVSLFTPSCNEKSKPLSILHGFRISDLERIYALEKLRHDATILYDYPKTPVLLPRFTESFSDKSTNARTQTIIDAAVAAMKRCDETI